MRQLTETVPKDAQGFSIAALRIAARMIAMGEKIPFGRDSELLNAAADEIEKLRRERNDLVAFLAGIGSQARSMANSYAANDSEDAT